MQRTGGHLQSGDEEGVLQEEVSELDGLASTLIYENSKYQSNLTVYVLKDANVDHHVDLWLFMFWKMQMLTTTLIYENSKYQSNFTVYVLKDANVDHHIL